eukprot:Sdes_comp19049_c0_seq7m9637
MASAAVLFFELQNSNHLVRFQTLSGILTAEKKPNQQVEINLPENPPNKFLWESQAKLIQSVIGNLPVQDCFYSSGTKKLLVRLDDATTRTQLEKILPNFNQMTLCESGETITGLIVTVKSKDPKYDFYSRYFAPWNGISCP